MIILAPLSDSCEIETANLPNPSTDACLAGLSADATVRKLVIVIHGFTKAFDTVWMHEMQRDIMRLDAGTAVVVRSKQTRQSDHRTNLFGNPPFQIVGWGHGIADIFHYYRAAANTRFA